MRGLKFAVCLLFLCLGAGAFFLQPQKGSAKSQSLLAAPDAPTGVAASDTDYADKVMINWHTMQHATHPQIFALGDAASLPTSKAGSVAHFSVEVFVENFVELANGRPMTHAFDGHANCFVESGDGKALLIDFNYDTEPLPGSYPVPAFGPFRLLDEAAVNHWGKLAFRWIYWNVLLPGRPIPLPAHMSMAGKHVPTPQE